MVFNQNHASILHFIFSSSIIIIVGLPTGLWLMRHMLYANDPITYASTENSEGFMIVRTPTAKQEQGGTTCFSFAKGVRGIDCEAGVSGWRLKTPSGRTRDGLPSKVIGLQNRVNETLLNSLRNQITHTAVINAMIYRDPQPPLIQRI
jgi:hypothetical protein